MTADRDSSGQIVLRVSAREAEHVRIALENFIENSWNVTERPHLVKTAKEVEDALRKAFLNGRFP